MSGHLFLGLVLAVAAGRVAELGLSRRNQRRLAERGAQRRPDPVYSWMVLFHTAVLAAAPAEVYLLGREWSVWIGGPALALWAASNALRWWVIRTLAVHWNTQVVDSTSLGVVCAGPYHWIRHPNYLAVYLELPALAMVHTAWATALAALVLHVPILVKRIRAEEEALTASPEYLARMGGKPRFLPRLFDDGVRQ